MPDWKTKESYSRLLAAVVASVPGMKLDYRKIASMYGEGATYDSIEGRFRIIKKEAAQLQHEIDSGIRPEAPLRGNGGSSANGSNSNNSTPRKPRTPKANSNSLSQNGGAVLNGRVTKSANGSPSKRKTAAQIKKEMLEGSSASSLSCGETSSSGLDGEGQLVHGGSYVFDEQHGMSFNLPMDGDAEQMSLMMTGSGFWDENGI